MNGLNPYLGKFLVSFGYLFTAIFATLICKIFNLFQVEFSYEPGFISSIMSGFASHFGNFFLILGYYYDPENQGIISIITIASSIIVSIVSFYLYKERLAVLDVLGMLICILGVIIIGIFSNEGSNTSYIAYTSGILALIFYAVANILPREAIVSGINIYKSILISLFSESAIGILNILILSFFIDVFEYNDGFLLSFIGGIFYGIGNFALNIGIIEGKIGIVSVIVNCSGLYQIGLDYVYRNITPDLGMFIGGCITFLGVSFLMLWKYLIKTS